MKLSASILATFVLSSLLQPLVFGQVNHKPVLRFRVPDYFNLYPFQPTRFAVSAYDPDGDTLTFTWKINARVIQTGRDSSYFLTYSDLQFPYSGLICIFADAGGLNDSTRWLVAGDVYVDDRTLPSQLFLAQNYPNPFNPSTTITYQLESMAHVTLTVYNMLGDLLVVLVDARQSSGTHELRWTPNLPSGVYYYRLSAASMIQTRKMVLLK